MASQLVRCRILAYFWWGDLGKT